VPVIQGGRWQRYLQKFLGIKGEVVAPELAPEIYAVLPIGNPPLEQLVLEGWIPYAGTNSLAALAGNIPILIIQNPPGSGVIGRLRRIIWATTAANSEVPLEITGNPNQSINPTIRGTSRDSRARPVTLNATVQPQTSAIGLRQMNSGATLGNIDFAHIFPILFGTTKTYYYIDLPDRVGWVINPGDQIAVQLNVVNVAVDYTVWWEERPIESSEASA
jgi:hypothetical protein